jgi:transcriptional regulator with XRE-family HTH domain
MATVAQIKAARALLGWSQGELATRAGLSLPTVARFETQSETRVSDEARAKMEAALEAAGIEFTNGRKQGVRLNKRRRNDQSKTGQK